MELGEFDGGLDTEYNGDGFVKISTISASWENFLVECRYLAKYT